jgi:hypothetical protein
MAYFHLSLLIVRFRELIKLISNQSLLSSFQHEYSDGMKRLLPILLLVFSVGEQR